MAEKRFAKKVGRRLVEKMGRIGRACSPSDKEEEESHTQSNLYTAPNVFLPASNIQWSRIVAERGLAVFAQVRHH